MRDEVFRIIDDMLRKADSQEEDKDTDEQRKQEYHHQRTESDCFEHVLSDVAFLKLLDFDNDFKEPDQLSAFNESTEDIIEHFSSSHFEALKSP
jgi:hypothetical protein